MSPRLMAIGLLWWPIVMTGMTLVPSNLLFSLLREAGLSALGLRRVHVRTTLASRSVETLMKPK